MKATFLTLVLILSASFAQAEIANTSLVCNDVQGSQAIIRIVLNGQKRPVSHMGEGIGDQAREILAQFTSACYMASLPYSASPKPEALRAQIKYTINADGLVIIDDLKLN